MSVATIETATGAHKGEVVEVIVRAFSEDPTAQWVWPDPQQYAEHFPDFVMAFGGNAFEHGGAHYLPDMAGAALWLPPGVSPDEEAIGEVLQRSVPAERLEEVNAFFEQMDHYHPTDPHWYLPLIGVDPAYHRRGLGSALMKYALSQCDRDGTPAYLESSNSENIPLYERHDFVSLGTIQFGSSPPMCPMLRQPQSI